jgi:5,10-methylene-tetrahydrofolate dehydrogenase/methenyl tetrahydrofolate cyclohydrolase
MPILPRHKGSQSLIHSHLLTSVNNGFNLKKQMANKALIIGVSAQNGAYLAKLLLKKGYEVHAWAKNFSRGSI